MLGGEESEENMGCHTWFSRPLTEEEFGWMREYACESANELFGPTESNISCGLYDLEAFSKFHQSFKDDSACYYGMTWYEAGFGADNPKFVERDGCEAHIRSVVDKSLSAKKLRKQGVKQKTFHHNLYVDMAFNLEYSEKFFHMSYKDMVESGVFKSVYFPYFHDVFRIYRYPKKIIHNRRQLRKYLGKRYFELSDYQLERISMFFKLYPGGVITFG